MQLLTQQFSTHLCLLTFMADFPEPMEVLKYCNFEEYSKCILLMYPKGDVLFLCWDVTIVFGHHRVMR